MVFGKLFASTYDGSMMGAGPWVFSVWPYALANCDSKGFVELNPKLVAVKIAGTIEAEKDVVTALEYLCAPDGSSRIKDEEGRRLVREGEYIHRIVNYMTYREMRNKEARREYHRTYMRKTRADVPAKVEPAPEAPPEEPVKRKRFVPPTPEEVNAYAKEKGVQEYVNGEQFCNFYESKGWLIGKNKMQKWHSAVATWVAHHKEELGAKRSRKDYATFQDWLKTATDEDVKTLTQKEISNLSIEDRVAITMKLHPEAYR